MTEEKTNIMQQCFVCKKEMHEKTPKSYNSKTHLPVCESCNGSEAEKKAEQEALDSLAEGFVCGCI